MNKKILIIDDEKDICFLISEILSDENYETTNSYSSDDAILKFKELNPDLIILDVWLDGSKNDGLELLRIFKKLNSHIPIIMISGHSTVDMAVQAIKEGAYDFLEKPFDTNKLLIITKRALEKSELLEENKELKKQNFKQLNLIGESAFVKNLKNTIIKIAPSTGRVLIYGPPGSGKKTIARIIHKNSLIKNRPFYVFNFSQSDAENNITNLFNKSLSDNSIIKSINESTILLDEISEIPNDTQVSLLRFLEEISLSKNKNQYNIRIISTTSKNIKDEIQKGNFRSDLFYRLNVIPLTLLPLKERSEDIKLFCDYFIKNSNHNKNKSIEISKDALAILELYNWPGNIRQLKNLIDRIMIMNMDNSRLIKIDASKLPQDMGEINVKNHQESQELLGLSMKEARDFFEKDYLLSQIKRFNGNITNVANFIGMERTALYRKIKSLNIDIDIKK